MKRINISHFIRRIFSCCENTLKRENWILFQTVGVRNQSQHVVYWKRCPWKWLFYEVSSRIWDKNSWKRFGSFLANLQHLKLRIFITDNLKVIIWNSHQWIIKSSAKAFQICALIFQKIYCQLLSYKKHCVI